MITSNKTLKVVLAFALSVGMLISSPQSITRAANSTDKVTVSLIGKYDSADTAAIRDIDTTRKIIRFRNHETGKTYTLSYDNTSMMYDARGTVLSAALLEVGEIVDVTFLKSSKHITTLNVSSEAWVVENTRNHDLVRGDGTARIQGETYRIDARTLVMAEGNLALAEDVLATDKITVSGIGKEIYSVVVTGGHGYVSLSSDTVEDHSLVGAWLELDNEVIHKISPNMMLSAPEGDYNLQILGNGASYQTEVNISRNQETVVDTSSVSISKPKESLVTFEIIPEDAEVFVDGQRMLTGTPQSINYGYHSLKVLADGYVTQDKYLKVGTAKAVIQIELEKDSDAAADASSEGLSSDGTAASSASTYASYPVGTIDYGASGSAASSAATVSANSSDESKDKPNKEIKGYKIYFDKPYGAEVYFDGAYVGVVPTSVNKISGNHEVILKMDGYETKSYRINVDKEEDNKSYSFPDLIKIEKDDDSSSSSSTSGEDSSSSSDTSGTDDSSDSGDSASTEDSSPAGDSSTTEDSAPAGDSGASSDSSSAEDTSEAGDSSSKGSSKENSPSEDSSKESSTNEGASDAANTASGE